MRNLTDINQFQEFDNLEFIARQVVEGFITGMHKSPYHGFSVEFAEHRIHNPGESVKHIDWRLFARSEKLFVKRYEEETNLRAHLILDISSSMLFPLEKPLKTKLAFSIYASAALIYLLRKQRDAVGLSFLSDKIHLTTDNKTSQVHAKYLYSQLNNLLNEFQQIKKLKNKATKSTDLTHSIHLIAEKLHKRSLVIIFSDMFDSGNTTELFEALQHLHYNKHEVILFHVSNYNYELDFNFSRRPHRFVDLETGEILKIQPGDIRKKYKEKTNEFYQQIKILCRKYHIELIEANVNNDFKEILLPFLVKRAKMY